MCGCAFVLERHLYKRGVHNNGTRRVVPVSNMMMVGFRSCDINLELPTGLEIFMESPIFKLLNLLELRS